MIMNSKITIETLEALRNGEHSAFEAVFIAYFNKIQSFIYGYIKSKTDAEDLTEDLFVNLWTNRQSIDLSKSFDSYLHTIARNAAINFLKHKYMSESYQKNTISLECGSTSEEDLIAKELGIFIDEVVERMPEQRKQIYILSRNKGLTNAEIAERLGTTKRNVESQLSFALKEIRKAISLFFILLF
jgi:RNA polymerase sigma-70 factor (ECF subfamily)